MINLKTKDWTIENVETVFFDKDGTFVDLQFFWGKMTELRAQEVIKRYNLNENLLDKLCLFLCYSRNCSKMLPNGITALYSRAKIIEIFSENLKELNVFATYMELEDIFDYVSEVFYENMCEYLKPIEPAINLIKKLKEKISSLQ